MGNKDDLSWLTTVPAGDGNFKSRVIGASYSDLEKALAMSQGGENKGRRTALERELRKRDKMIKSKTKGPRSPKTGNMRNFRAMGEEKLFDLWNRRKQFKTDREAINELEEVMQEKYGDYALGVIDTLGVVTDTLMDVPKSERASMVDLQKSAVDRLSDQKKKKKKPPAKMGGMRTAPTSRDPQGKARARLKKNETQRLLKQLDASRKGRPDSHMTDEFWCDLTVSDWDKARYKYDGWPVPLDPSSVGWTPAEAWAADAEKTIGYIARVRRRPRWRNFGGREYRLVAVTKLIGDDNVRGKETRKSQQRKASLHAGNMRMIGYDARVVKWKNQMGVYVRPSDERFMGYNDQMRDSILMMDWNRRPVGGFPSRYGPYTGRKSAWRVRAEALGQDGQSPSVVVFNREIRKS